MKGCTAVLDLGWDELVHCDHHAGHPGPHYTEAWGPDGITWYEAAA